MYESGYPCCDILNHLVQVGITNIVTRARLREFTSVSVSHLDDALVLLARIEEYSVSSASFTGHFHSAI